MYDEVEQVEPSHRALSEVALDCSPKFHGYGKAASTAELSIGILFHGYWVTRQILKRLLQCTPFDEDSDPILVVVQSC